LVKRTVAARDATGAVNAEVALAMATTPMALSFMKM
jgi:hypothetical protein